MKTIGLVFLAGVCIAGCVSLMEGIVWMLQPSEREQSRWHYHWLLLQAGSVWRVK